MIPLSRYKFYQNGNKTIAVSSYAGRSVRGVATCAPGDSFDSEKGRELAAARCNKKVAERRLKRAQKKAKEAEEAWKDAQYHLIQMMEYEHDADMSLEVAEAHVKHLESLM